MFVNLWHMFYWEIKFVLQIIHVIYVGFCRYGGIYIDSDVIVLRSLSLLNNSVALEDQHAGGSLNGAVMAFRKNRYEWRWLGCGILLVMFVKSLFLLSRLKISWAPRWTISMITVKFETFVHTVGWNLAFPRNSPPPSLPPNQKQNNTTIKKINK